MKRCSNCNKEVEDNIDLCPNCGKPTESLNTSLTYNYSETDEISEKPETNQTALKTAGRALGFVGRLIWAIINYALAVVCFATISLLGNEAWYMYILMPVLAIFLLVNGTRCISGKSFWIFY